MLIFRASGPFTTPRNHDDPFRRAKIATSPIPEPGNTTVSSQVLGIDLNNSTAGLSSSASGFVP